MTNINFSSDGQSSAMCTVMIFMFFLCLHPFLNKFLLCSLPANRDSAASWVEPLSRGCYLLAFSLLWAMSSFPPCALGATLWIEHPFPSCLQLHCPCFWTRFLILPCICTRETLSRCTMMLEMPWIMTKLIVHNRSLMQLALFSPLCSWCNSYPY